MANNIENKSTKVTNVELNEACALPTLITLCLPLANIDTRAFIFVDA